MGKAVVPDISSLSAAELLKLALQKASADPQAMAELLGTGIIKKTAVKKPSWQLSQMPEVEARIERMQARLDAITDYGDLVQKRDKAQRVYEAAKKALARAKKAVSEADARVFSKDADLTVVRPDNGQEVSVKFRIVRDETGNWIVSVGRGTGSASKPTQFVRGETYYHYNRNRQAVAEMIITQDRKFNVTTPAGLGIYPSPTAAAKAAAKALGLAHSNLRGTTFWVAKRSQ